MYILLFRYYFIYYYFHSIVLDASKVSTSLQDIRSQLQWVFRVETTTRIKVGTLSISSDGNYSMR